MSRRATAARRLGRPATDGICTARRCQDLLVLLLAVACGCSGGRIYNAARLPAEYRIGPTSDTSMVNLTRLASPAGNNALIGHGDLLELTIATGYETDRINALLVRVDETGSINVPLVGTVPVAGLEPGEAEQNIAALAIQRAVYQRPYVTLMVKRQRANKVTIVGAVQTPGTYQLPHGSSDLLGALAAAGGLTEEAGKEVEVLRKSRRAGLPLAPPGPGPGPGPSPDGAVAGALASYTRPGAVPDAPASYRVSLDQVSDISDQGTSDYGLGDGDVVMVFPRQPRVVHVMGLVRKPDQFEIPPNKDLYLLGALAMAGGRTMQVADKVRVIRHLPAQPEPVVIMASVREAKAGGPANLRLAPGDLVSVEETPVTFVLDTLKSFVRFGFSAATPFF